MRMDCEAAREHIDAWALGALDTDERIAFDAHLATCTACPDLAERARDGGTAVALAVPLKTASPSLKARIMASAAVLAGVSRRRSPWWAATAAAAIVAAAGLFGWSAYLQTRIAVLDDDNATIVAAATAQSREFASLRSQLVSTSAATDEVRSAQKLQDSVLYIVAQPDAQLTRMDGTAMAPEASGHYVWSPGERLGAFDATSLPALPPGQTYRFWFVYENQWLDAGLIDIDDDGNGRLVVSRLQGGRPDRGSLLGYALSVEQGNAAPASPGQLVLSSPQQ
ncbi:MAG: anti-sigma factor [Dehalococcoidia bacterium]